MSNQDQQWDLNDHHRFARHYEAAKVKKAFADYYNGKDLLSAEWRVECSARVGLIKEYNALLRSRKTIEASIQRQYLIAKEASWGRAEWHSWLQHCGFPQQLRTIKAKIRTIQGALKAIKQLEKFLFCKEHFPKSAWTVQDRLDNILTASEDALAIAFADCRVLRTTEEFLHQCMLMSEEVEARSPRRIM